MNGGAIGTTAQNTEMKVINHCKTFLAAICEVFVFVIGDGVPYMHVNERRSFLDC